MTAAVLFFSLVAAGCRRQTRSSEKWQNQRMRWE